MTHWNSVSELYREFWPEHTSPGQESRRAMDEHVGLIERFPKGFVKEIGSAIGTSFYIRIFDPPSAQTGECLAEILRHLQSWLPAARSVMRLYDDFRRKPGFVLEFDPAATSLTGILVESVSPLVVWLNFRSEFSDEFGFTPEVKIELVEGKYAATSFGWTS